MAAEIFTDDWAQLWADRINANENYRKAAERWEGAIGLVMSADSDMGIPEERVVIADLWHGECRSARSGSDADLDDVPYLIRSNPSI